MADNPAQVKEEIENNADYLKPYSVKGNGE